jgi:hypothetical protein
MITIYTTYFLGVDYSSLVIYFSVPLFKSFLTLAALLLHKSYLCPASKHLHISFSLYIIGNVPFLISLSLFILL